MAIEDDPEGRGLDYPPRRVRGQRWTVLTDEVSRAIENALRAGATIADACENAGIHPDSYYEWCRRGENYHERLASTPPNEFEPDEWEARFEAFYLKVRTARAEYRIRANLTMVDLMDPEMPPNVRFRAAAFALERTDPANWGRQVAITGSHGGPIDVRDVTEDDQSIAARLRKRFQDRAIDAASREVKPLPEYDEWSPWAGDPDDVPDLIWPTDL